MSKPKLIYLFDVEDGATEAKGLFEIDILTNELYFNKQKVQTAVKLNTLERFLAVAVSISTVIMATCSLLNTLNLFKVLQ